MEKTINYMFIGDYNSGKTSIIQTFVNGHTVHCHANTIGIDIDFKTVFVKGESVKLRIKDTAGQDRFKSMISRFYNDVDIFFIVFDISSEISFNNMVYWIEEAVNVSQAKIYIVGNKIDRIRKVSFKDAHSLAKQYNFKYIETTISDFKTIETLFMYPFKSKVHEFDKSNQNHVLDLNDLKRPKCCMIG